MESYEILWKTILPELEKTVSSISFDTYISTLKSFQIDSKQNFYLVYYKLF